MTPTDPNRAGEAQALDDHLAGDPWLSPTEVAAQLHINERAVRLLLSSGQLPHVAISPRVRRVRLSDLQTFMAERRTETERRLLRAKLARERANNVRPLRPRRGGAK